MTVYVDDMLMAATVNNKGRPVKGQWSHLFADTIEELKEFGQLIGMREEWLQNSHGFVHYDVVVSRRNHALKLGATPVRYRDLPDYIKQIERQL